MRIKSIKYFALLTLTGFLFSFFFNSFNYTISELVQPVVKKHNALNVSKGNLSTQDLFDEEDDESDNNDQSIINFSCLLLNTKCLNTTTVGSFPDTQLKGYGTQIYIKWRNLRI